MKKIISPAVVLLNMAMNKLTYEESEKQIRQILTAIEYTTAEQMGGYCVECMQTYQACTCSPMEEFFDHGYKIEKEENPLNWVQLP